MAFIEYVSIGKPAEELLPVLAKANRFSMEDLRQNRSGRISGAQMAAMARKALRPVIYVLIASLMWAGLLLLASKLGPTAPYRVLRVLRYRAVTLVMGVLGCLGAIIATVYKTGKLTLGLMLDLASGRVAMLEGRVQPSREGCVELGVQLFKPRTADSEIEHATAQRYHYVIQNEYFEVDLPAFEALAPRTNYRLYYGPHSKLLLSIEPLA